jgi:hypothetical protein
MDNQQLFNIVVSIGGFLAAYVLNMVTQRIQKLEDKIEDMHELYVKKNDYKDDIREIKDILRQIFEKLDSKADKS